MSEEKAFLVVGGDSLVGKALFLSLKMRGHKAYATTRKSETVSGERVYLDFEDQDAFSLPAGVDYAFIVAAATDYGRCERDPMARVVNVELIPRLTAFLLERGVFVSFISTNSLFGGEAPWPDEDAPHAPGIPYARQKSEGEQAIRAAADRMAAGERLSIVRLTKILNHDTPPLPSWLASWQRGETVTPFSDLIFAPMSVRFVSEALALLGEKRIPGPLHLSGADNVNYVDMASRLSASLGVAPELVAATTATEKAVEIPFKPRFSGLGMQRTTSLSGIAPQTLEQVVADLCDQFGALRQGTLSPF